MKITTIAGRVGAIAVLAAAAIFTTAGPALAHVEVKADNAQAGARDVTLTFTAEAESTTAGIASLRVVLPAGIAPSTVSYVSGPSGWTLTATADGFTVSGAPVPTGKDAECSVKIGQLPADATSLAFKTLQTYGDGRVDRWIELAAPGAAAPAEPAPVLVLKPASTPATSAAPVASAAPAASAAASTAAVVTTPSAGNTKKSNATWWWLLGGSLVVIVVVAVLLNRRPSGAAKPKDK